MRSKRRGAFGGMIYIINDRPRQQAHQPGALKNGKKKTRRFAAVANGSWRRLHRALRP
jgi:hypothetical protein